MIPEVDERFEEALRASANGDQQAFADVCNWCSERLMKYCRSRLCFEDLRSAYQEDLLNQVFQAFWCEINKRPACFSLTSPMAWCILRRIAKSLAYDHYRRQYCRKRRPSEGIRNFNYEQHSPSIEYEGIMELEIRESRDEFLNRLGESDRTLVEMRRAGVDIGGIARQLQVGSSTLYNRLRHLELSFKNNFD
jgi:DNA-directed RNA polymerase specialized sigma24 family protein